MVKIVHDPKNGTKFEKISVGEFFMGKDKCLYLKIKDDKQPFNSMIPGTSTFYTYSPDELVISVDVEIHVTEKSV